MIGQLTKERAEEIGYRPARILPDGRCAGIMGMLYTCALVIGIDEEGFSTRYCYHSRAEAELALKSWDGTGEPPGNWIKQKPEERNNPNYKIPIPDEI